MAWPGGNAAADAARGAGGRQRARDVTTRLLLRMLAFDVTGSLDGFEGEL
jgi:hypothetical protein